MDSGLTKDWSLHPQLVLDTVPVGDMPLTRVLLASDANYPWLILVPRLPGLVEFIDLEEARRYSSLARSRRPRARSRRLPHATSSISRPSETRYRSSTCT